LYRFIGISAACINTKIAHITYLKCTVRTLFDKMENNTSTLRKRRQQTIITYSFHYAIGKRLLK